MIAAPSSFCCGRPPRAYVGSPHRIPPGALRLSLQFAAPTSAAIPITFASKETWAAARATLSPAGAAFAENAGFDASPGQVQLLPDAKGSLDGVLFAIENGARHRDPLLPGKLSTCFPPETYPFANA